ncbi:hypothetical protein EGT74_14760 [Chitinophaga lutea]|uniref:TraB/GumN family protein n=1 Tax=Chitinophaga lutea TaxID=2488634 RepID=A0A3N4PKI0_9BACT|nr:hypothetical protein EGT74_14760 [Chitinophaga lutea]
MTFFAAKLLKGTDCFVAVGLAHLFYSDGILAGLQRSGFTVEPVPVR